MEVCGSVVLTHWLYLNHLEACYNIHCLPPPTPNLVLELVDLEWDPDNLHLQ